MQSFFQEKLPKLEEDENRFESIKISLGNMEHLSVLTVPKINLQVSKIFNQNRTILFYCWYNQFYFCASSERLYYNSVIKAHIKRSHSSLSSLLYLWWNFCYLLTLTVSSVSMFVIRFSLSWRLELYQSKVFQIRFVEYLPFHFPRKIYGNFFRKRYLVCKFSKHINSH